MHSSTLAVRPTGSDAPSSGRPAGLQAAHSITQPLLNNLDGLLRQLERLPRLTERSFQAVSGNLRDVSGRLRAISQHAAQAAQLMAGSEGQSVLADIQQALEIMSEQLQGGDRGAEASVAGLKRIMVELEAIQRLVTDFQDRVGTLRMLKTSTNILGARAAKGGGGFQSVGNAIGNLALDIKQKSSDIHAKKRSLSGELQKAIAKVTSLKESRRKLTGSILAEIRHAIANMVRMHDNCARVADDLAGRSGTMSTALGEVVVALQFQDITRQQIEHAGRALGELRMEVADSLRAGEGAPKATRSVCALQSAQITHSVTELEQAIGHMAQNLKGVASEASSTSCALHELFGMAGSVGGSSIAGIESGLASVMAAFAESRRSADHLAEIMLAVTSAMGEITSFVKEIDYIGFEIKLIAQNAIVKAAQAGKDGAAFGVIAATVEHESVIICQRARAITDSIVRISAQVADLQADLPARAGIAPGGQVVSGVPDAVAGDFEDAMAGDLGDEMAFALDTLRSLSSSVLEQLEQTDRMAEGLAGDLQATVAALEDQELGSLLYRELPVQLAELQNAVLAACQGGRELGVRHTLESLKQQYTMHSERQVHERFTAQAPPAAVAAPVPLSVADDEFLGANIELF
ncbi:hypothetical protein L4X63_16485 [Geomonas sp. Red32]|uniref:hypothetical protein n=1 Tax=Geomonas sp. Red32 TaxID=2912856 RepID=UPI00202CD963|nr:hypothetical protein [Geomonas sp. Red32]MCM0083184.1 hypothetical protein [Geomonas sp. Red32]